MFFEIIKTKKGVTVKTLPLPEEFGEMESVTISKYTKHYYASTGLSTSIGSERVASALGSIKSLGLLCEIYGADAVLIAEMNNKVEDAAEVMQTIYDTFEKDRLLPTPFFYKDVFQRCDFTHYQDMYHPYWYHPDHLGSSSYITNLDGEITQHMEYLPFGELLVEEHLNSYNSPFKFSALELDSETGNYYAVNRYYNPKWSIWMSVDPLAEIAPDKTPYHFVSNNPINRIDPDGLTDYTINKKTGDVTQIGEANDEPDRVLKTNRKGEVKYKKNGDARVAIDDIEQGILSDGMNLKTSDNVIEVGGEGQATEDGVKSFTLQLSEYIGKEIKGFSYSADGSGDVTDVVLGKYIRNLHDKSYGSVTEIAKKYGANFSFDNVTQQFHTHPDGKLGATQSAPGISKDIDNLQRDKPHIPNASFIILYRIMGQEKPAEYDYTHQYRPKRK